jgi:hypothetical protein
MNGAANDPLVSRGLGDCPRWLSQTGVHTLRSVVSHSKQRNVAVVVGMGGMGLPIAHRPSSGHDL